MLAAAAGFRRALAPRTIRVRSAKTQLFHLQACGLDQYRVQGDFLSDMGVEL